MSTASLLRALAGGILIGLASSIALISHGRIAGISGTLSRAFDADGGRTFRFTFLAGLVAVGVVAAIIAPSTLGAPTRGFVGLAIAGGLVGIGTTLGSGCTSGHGVCGLSRGSSRSVVAVITFMVTAAITVAIVGVRS